MDPNIYERLIPLFYLVIISLIAGGLHAIGVPVEMITLIVGGGLTRVKNNK